LREFGLALGSGVAVAVLAALHPAWEAVRASPLENVRQTAWQPAGRSKKSWPKRVALLCFLAAPVLLLFAPTVEGAVAKFSVGVAGMLVFLLGLAAFCPAVITFAVRRLQQSKLSLSWVEVRLASDSLLRNPLRSGITVATMVISLAAIFTIASFVNSVRGSLLAWVDQMVTADLIVSSGARTAGPKNVPLREDLAPELRGIPGIQVIDLYRLIRSTYQGKPILIESFSARDSASVRTLPMAEGDGTRALREMADAKGVIVSESFQSKFGTRSGDRLELVTPSGKISFPVLGVYIDYSSDSGSVLIDRALYKKYWQDELLDAFDLWLEPGADQQKIIETIKQRHGERYELFVSTHGELRDAVVKIMEQSFVVNYAVEIVAVVVAIFSVINTLLASVLDRTREIGVLRAIGATQAQVRRSVIAEAAWMGLIGGVLGLFAGTVMAYHHVVYNTKQLTGWTFQFYYPYDVAVVAIIAAVVLCILAGFAPAKQAASLPIVSAIGYE
jgi:putative ABC transport system permease protein